jgi:hypothetical protein
MGIVERRPKHREILASELHVKDADGKSLGHDDKLGTALHRYDENFGSGLGSTHEAIYDEDYIGNRLPESVMDENLEVEWDRVAQLAGMDAGERIVLTLQRIGLGRRAALATCFTEDDRRLLEAAWKRFDRRKDTLKEVLLSGKAMPARQAHGARLTAEDPLSQLELIFIELPEGGMKISFKKYVPKTPK